MTMPTIWSGKNGADGIRALGVATSLLGWRQALDPRQLPIMAYYVAAASCLYLHLH
jgi:hypothetical protein